MLYIHFIISHTYKVVQWMSIYMCLCIRNIVKPEFIFWQKYVVFISFSPEIGNSLMNPKTLPKFYLLICRKIYFKYQFGITCRLSSASFDIDYTLILRCACWRKTWKKLHIYKYYLLLSSPGPKPLAPKPKNQKTQNLGALGWHLNDGGHHHPPTP